MDAGEIKTSKQARKRKKNRAEEEGTHTHAQKNRRTARGEAKNINKREIKEKAQRRTR